MGTDKDKPTGTSPTKTRLIFCVESINKIAHAMNVKLSEGTIAVYTEKLSCLSTAQMALATSKTISEWPEPSKMPPIPFIIERAYETIDDAPSVLDRVSTALIDEAKRSGITPEEIQAWLEGKDITSEDEQIIRALIHVKGFDEAYIEAVERGMIQGKRGMRSWQQILQSDPKWQAMRKRFGKRGLDTAKKQGWI